MIMRLTAVKNKGTACADPSRAAKKTINAVVLGLVIAAVPVAAKADTVVYSDVTNFTSRAYNQGGAGTVAGSTGLFTKLAADDITPIAGSAGQNVTGLTFSVANLNQPAVTASVILAIYSDNGNAPGAEIKALQFTPITFAGGNAVATFSYDPGTIIFTLPSTGTFWAGLIFTDNGGTTGATASQLNNLGQGLFSPPTVGSSQDEFFLSNAATNGASSNPAGLLQFFGGNPPADFGFQFSVASPAASPVPEPSSICLILTGVGGVIGAARRRRRV